MNDVEKRKSLKVGKIAKEVNDALREFLGQAPSTVPASGKAARALKDEGFPLDPEALWKRWKKTRLEEGWVYGPTYNEENKTHPNLVESYAHLHSNEKIKDYVFWAACKAAYAALESK